MDDTIIGLFPDRETANHAISELAAAGFSPSRTNAEDFERPDYYLNQMPQGATLVTVDAGAKADEARLIMVRCGGREVEDIISGAAKTPTAWHGDPAGGVPAAEPERESLAAKSEEERSLRNRIERALGS